MLLREALIVQLDSKRQLLVAESLDRAAWIAADLHDPLRAARLFGAATACHERLGAPIQLGDMPFQRARLEAVKASLSEAVFAARWAEGRAMSLDQAAAYALSDAETAPGA